MWLRVATMQMVDAAALWLQSVEPQLDTATWEQFCIMVRDRFDRDQHELLVEKRPLIQGPNQALVPAFFAPGTRETFSPGWWIQPGVKLLSRLVAWPVAENIPLVPVGSTNRD